MQTFVMLEKVEQPWSEAAGVDDDVTFSVAAVPFNDDEPV